MQTQIRLNPDPTATSGGSSVENLAAAMQSGNIVSQIESQIENFRRLCNETTKRASDLEARESDVKRLVEELARKEQDLTGKWQEAERLRAEAEQKAEELRQKEAALAEEQTRSQQSAEESTRRIAEASQQHEKAEKLASEALAKLSQLEADMSNAMQALALAFNERERLESQRGDLQRRLDASQNQSNEHAALSSEVGSLRQKLAHTESEYGGMRAQLDAVGKERAEREAELTGALESLAKAESQVAELRARHEASLQSAGEETRRTIDELRHKLNTLETQREQELDVHADEVSQMKKAVAKAEAAATELLDQHSAAEKASSEAARAQIESLKSDLAKVTAQFEEERAGRDRERAELKAALGKAEADASELQAKHAAGMQAGGEEFAKTIRGLQSQLDGVNAELAQREDALRVLSQRLLSSEERALEHEAKMSEMTIALERATEEAAEAMRQRDESMSLPSRLAGQEAGRLIVRKTRLERYKRLLAVQSDKLYRAKAALKTRTDECEKVLAKRQEIVDAVMELEKQKQIVAKRQAATGALGWVCYAVVTLGLVGVIGWHVAGQVAPATYIASAEITADTRGNTPSADELAAWAESIKALAKDPQTLGAAAENYLRRGTPSLGNLAAVKQKMDRDLYLKAEQPGMIKVEMRSAGRERAMRELETFIASLAGEAERQRTLRADGCGTIVTQQPQAGSEPLESERMLWAASIGGGGFVACLMGAGFIYRMLLRSRYKFEQEQLALENG